MTAAPGRISRSGLLLAALLAALPFLPALGSDRTLWYRDVGQNHLPNRVLAARMLREGRLPLWNPYRGNGQPFMANPNSLVLRPTTPLFLLLPEEKAHVAFTVSVLLLAALAGAGTFALLADAGRSGAAALAGSGAFALSGAFQSLGQLVNLMEGAAWIPLTLFLLGRALRRDGCSWGALCGLSLAMILSTGEPVLAATTILAAPLVPGFWSAPRRRLLLVAAVTGAVALLVSAAQILPLLELVSESARSGALASEQAMKWSLPPVALLQAALPSLWGDPTRAAPASYWGSGLFDTSLPFLTSLHVGLPLLLLACLGWAGGGSAARAGVLVAALATVLALGRHLPGVAPLVRHLPGIGQSRYPVKWLLLATLALAFLAAAGFDRLVPRRGERTPALRLPRGLGAALAVVTLGGLALRVLAPGGAVPIVRFALRIPERFADQAVAVGAVRAIGGSLAVAGLASLGVLLAARAPGIPRHVRPAAAAIPCLGILLWGAWSLNPAAPRHIIFEPSPLVDAIPAGRRSEQRLYAFPRPRGFGYRTPAPDEAAEAGLPADSLAWGMRWDMRTLRFGAPALEGIRGAWDQAGESLLGLEPAASAARRLAEGLAPGPAVRLLRAASVGWVLGYGDLPHEGLEEIADLAGESNVTVRMHALAGALPRASLIRDVQYVGSAEEALAAIESGRVNPAATLLLEGGPPEALAPPGDGVPGASGGGAVIEIETPGSLRLSVASPGGGWLLLTDSWAPGWRVEIDGTRGPLRRGQGAFRAVHVPAGVHEVTFTYRPRSVEVGLAGSVTGLVLAAGLLIARRWIPAAGEGR